VAQLADEVRDSTVYWFTILEVARERGDFVTAAQAQRELQRLGVRVRYGRRALLTSCATTGVEVRRGN
jgi:hypothetical protein